MALRGVGVAFVVGPALALDEGEENLLRVVGEVGRQEAAALGLGAAAAAAAIVGGAGLVGRAAEELLPLEAAVLDRRVGEDILDRGLWAEGVLEDIEAAAGVGGCLLYTSDAADE